MKICMFVKNSFEYDARVTKEARTLIDDGHDVTVVAIHVPGVTPVRETTPSGIRVIRVSRKSYGLRRLLSLHRRVAVRAEAARASSENRPIDPGRLRGTERLVPASTATPGDAQQGEPVVDVPAPKGRSARIQARLLGVLVRLLQLVFRLLRAVFQHPARAAKTYSLNRRFIGVGLELLADAYHAHDLNTLWIASVCKRRTGAHLIYDAHELHTDRNRMGTIRRHWATWTERRGLRQADAIITASPCYADVMSDRYGIDAPVVILNVPYQQEITTPVDLHALLGIPAEERLVVYVGSIQENRGLEQLIDAVTLLDRCTAVIIGYGHHRPVLEGDVDQRRLNDKVRFYGPVPNEDLLRHAAGADVGACNIVGASLSYYHSMPNKLFEYVMAGIPVITSDYPCMGGFVKEHDVGIVCRPDEPESVAKAISAVVDDEHRSRQLRENARRAARIVNWEREEQALLEIYRVFEDEEPPT